VPAPSVYVLNSLASDGGLAEGTTLHCGL
jgi:hypothetical protein